MLTYDFADQYFPWRFFVTESLLNGELPLWNPYEMGGIPIHGDPQSGAWYPFLYVHALLFGKYTLYSAFIELFLTLYIAAIGLYKLAKHFACADWIAILMGLMYASSGFFVGNMQHLTYMISGAFVPFVFLYFNRILASPNWFDSIKLGLILFLILTGGYPAFLIITFYILLFWILFHFIKHKNWKKISIVSLHFFVTAIVFVMCSVVVLYSMYQLFPLTARGNGVVLKDALFGPFSFQSFRSFLIPLSTVKNPECLGTDISMANGYFGIIFLIFLIFSLFDFAFFKKNILFYLIALSALLFSVGDILPFREWLFRYVPFMNLFRFPSTFRLFFIVFFILVAGKYLQYYFTENTRIKQLNYLLILTFLILLSSCLYGFYKTENLVGLLNFNEFKSFASLSELFFTQSFIQLVVISTVLFFFYYKKQLFFKSALIAIILIDCFLTVNLNLPFTGYNHQKSAQETQQVLNKLPSGITVNDHILLKNSNDIDGSIPPFWKNLCIYKKEIAYDGYNVFFIKAYDEFASTPAFKKVIENKFYFLAKETTLKDSSFLYATSNDKYEIVQNDSAGKKASLLRFSSTQMEFHVQNAKDDILVVFQNLVNHKVTINEKAVTPFKINNTLIGIPINEKSANVKVVYEPDNISLLFKMSAISFLLSVLICVVLYFKNRKEIIQSS